MTRCEYKPIYPHRDPIPTYELSTIIILILQMRKLKPDR